MREAGEEVLGLDLQVVERDFDLILLAAGESSPAQTQGGRRLGSARDREVEGSPRLRTSVDGEGGNFGKHMLPWRSGLFLGSSVSAEDA